MNRILAFVVTVALLFVGCGNATNKSVVATGSTMAAQQPKEVAPAVIVPIFDADSAYAYVASQVAFGPRVPNTAAHRACGDYLVSKFRSYGAEVVTQEVDLTAYNGDAQFDSTASAVLKNDGGDAPCTHAKTELRGVKAATCKDAGYSEA